MWPIYIKIKPFCKQKCVTPKFKIRFFLKFDLDLTKMIIKNNKNKNQIIYIYTGNKHQNNTVFVCNLFKQQNHL